LVTTGQVSERTIKSMRAQKKHFLFLLALIVFTAGIFAEAKPASTSKQVKPDVRLLIDISGSMKTNDPNNLRIPALQLVTNLMPAGAESGVWAFGRYVNMMVPLAQVDSRWQQQATKAARKINSAGLFTNIGSAMSKASYGWRSPNPLEKRSMILLTDGMVDIDKNPQVNALARKKILQDILPKLKAAKVAIHTIALSQNADHELLKTLSTQTDGWYQAVDSAEELEKVFLKIFEQAADRDSLPLEDNQFNVDASIEEMTLLVFKQKNANDTRLVDPNGQAIATASGDGKVRWFGTAGYDLITVKKPVGGKWRIEAEVDPDNRVMVVSNLGLNIKEVPNNLLAGEAIDYQLSLVEEGEVIRKQDFLKLVEARLIQNRAGETSRLAMFFDPVSSQFKQNFFTDDFEGVLDLTLEVKSPTFERIRKHAINIYGSPLQHEITVSDKQEDPHLISLIVRSDIVKPDSLKVSATLTFPDGEKQYLAVEDFSQPIEVRVLPQGGDYSLAMEIEGESVLARQFKVSPAPIEFNAPALTGFAVEIPEAAEEAPQPEEVTPPVEEELIEPQVKNEEQKPPEVLKPAEEQPQEDEVDWTMWLYVGLGINLFLGVLGFFGWKLFKKRSQMSAVLLTNELSIDDDESGEGAAVNSVAEKNEGKQ